MYEEFGIKELYEVAFKATNNMRVFNQDFEKDEVIMYFDNIQMSNINTSVDRYDARGGKNNFSQIIWENIDGMDFQFESGKISKNGFNLLTQSTMKDYLQSQISIPKRENLITDVDGKVTLERNATTTRPTFAYITEGGIITQKVISFSVVDDVVDLGVANAYKSVIIDYYYMNTETTVFEIGGDRIKGVLKLTAKIEAVDEKDGTRKEVLLVVPRMQLLSNISLTLGIKANPIVSTFRMRALPDKDGKALGRFFFLNE